MLLRWLAPLTFVALTLFSAGAGGAGVPPVRMPIRIVDVRGAASILQRGAAVLDARDAASFAQGHLPGAQMYAWQAFTGEGAARGRLKADPRALAQQVAALGVDGGRPTLVYGSGAGGWGEEGHAAWMLALLGHPDVALLDGGFTAWKSAGRPVVTSHARAAMGRFDARWRDDLVARKADLGAARAQVIDVRSGLEFRGSTPYGEARGGHIAGARHIDWRTLLDERGRLVPSSRVLRLLADAGIDPNREIITYCTCGVRSAMAAVALASRGVGSVRNYDGSLAEWSADPDAPMER
ncbi:MAG: sulfurtransferase [Myxococcaceae bacterium]|nr:MAG: sulfurtransferase [Myxococcaceae bacterium]